MTSNRVLSKEASDYIRRLAVNNHAEYLKKTIILSTYTNLPHPPMQNIAFLKETKSATMNIFRKKNILFLNHL